MGVIKPGHQTTFTCPRCNQVIRVAIGVSDFEHTCNSGNVTLDQEDKVVIGNWTDFDGTTGTVNPSQLSTAGLVNKLALTKSQAQEGSEKVPELTRRGKRADTHRQRQHFEFIEFNENGKVKQK